MPTLLDIAGSDIPDSVDGESLLPLTGQPEIISRSWLHGEHSYGEFSNHWIVTPTDKYIWLCESGEEQYFNLADDPHELENLIDAPQAQERIQKLRQRLIEVLSGRPEGFTDGNILIPGRPYEPVLPSALGR